MLQSESKASLKALKKLEKQRKKVEKKQKKIEPEIRTENRTENRTEDCPRTANRTEDCPRTETPNPSKNVKTEYSSSPRTENRTECSPENGQEEDDDTTLVEKKKKVKKEKKERKKRKLDLIEKETLPQVVDLDMCQKLKAETDLKEDKETLITVQDQHIDSYRPHAIQKIKQEEIPENLRISSLQLHPSTVKCLEERNVKALFPMQAAAFKPIMEGKDLLARARTGTGKTLAFSLPMIETIKTQRQKEPHLFKVKGRGPRALIMAPTRELALQVCKELTQICAEELVTACFYGGTFYDEQFRALNDGLDIIVGTPGRLIDHVDKGSLVLSNLSFVCLDEADQMLDIGFAEDMDKLIKQVIEQKNGHFHQTLLFSATMPDWIKNAVKNYMRADKITLDLIGSSKQKTSDLVSHYSLPSRWQNRSDILGDVVACYGNGNNGRSIIFVETKNEANELVMNEKLVSMGAQVLHGDISQNQREQTMQGYRDGKFTVLITTNVCARGVDIPEVDLVINAEPPKDVETYIHRSGRTGRAGRSGICVTFFKQDQAYLIEAIQRRAGIELKKISAPTPESIVSHRVTQTIEDLTRNVDPTVFNYFQSASAQLITHFNGDSSKAVSCCLALLCGTTKPLLPRSLVTANEGWLTLLFTSSRPMRSIGLVKSLLSPSAFPTLDLFNDTTGWKLSVDTLSVVCDFKHDKVKVEKDGCVLITGKPFFGQGVCVQVCTELPELQQYGTPYGSSRRFSGRDSSRSSGNYRGGQRGFSGRSGGTRGFGGRDGGSRGSSRGNSFGGRGRGRQGGY